MLILFDLNSCASTIGKHIIIVVDNTCDLPLRWRLLPGTLQDSIKTAVYTSRVRKNIDFGAFASMNIVVFRTKVFEAAQEWIDEAVTLDVDALGTLLLARIKRELAAKATLLKALCRDFRFIKVLRLLTVPDIDNGTDDADKVRFGLACLKTDTFEMTANFVRSRL